MAILFSLMAAAFIALSNLFMRKSVDVGGTSKGFLAFQMGTAFWIAVLIQPVWKGDFSMNLSIVGLGSVAGLILAGMIFCLGRAVEKGPPGLTFSILSAATVMPGIAMALLFGSLYGFIYTAWHGIGSLLVLGGLFLAGADLQGLREKRRWVFFSSAMFLLHVCLLGLFQWRALLLRLPYPEELTSLFTAETIQSSWFVPFMYLVSSVVQWWIYLSYERRIPKSQEIFYGVCGGIANSFCTFFLVWATELATSIENAIIFPVFSVAGIIFSNLWGQKLYQEAVNWRACQLCAFGLVIGTVDWAAIASAIGF